MIILGGIFETNNIENKIKNFNKELEKEDFWKNKISAQKILKEKKFIEDIYKGFNYTVKELDNLELLLELATKENDSDVVKDCDAVVIMTEWNEFRGMDLSKLKKLMSTPIILDTRNILNISELKKLEFKFDNVGRK